MKEWAINLPIYLTKGKKNISLNLNWYRNAYHYTLNEMKHKFEEVIQADLESLPVFSSVELTYTLYVKTKRRCDVSNFCCIVDKFFCDALVKAGKLPDDNYEYLPKVNFLMGGVDPLNPRITVTIKGKVYEIDS